MLVPVAALDRERRVVGFPPLGNPLVSLERVLRQWTSAGPSPLALRRDRQRPCSTTTVRRQLSATTTTSTCRENTRMPFCQIQCRAIPVLFVTGERTQDPTTCSTADSTDAAVAEPVGMTVTFGFPGSGVPITRYWVPLLAWTLTCASA